MRYDGSGKLDQKVIIQDFTQNSDGFGGSTKTWTEYCIRWAKFVSLMGDTARGGETVIASALQGTDNRRCILRYDSITKNINNTMCLKWENKNYNIRHAGDMYNDKRFIELICESGVADG